MILQRLTLAMLVLALTAPLIYAEEGESEEDIALDAVPAEVLAAAQAAAEGATFTSAERETEDGVVVYELKGTLGEDKVEVEVAADGTVIETEIGDDDDDDDDDESEGECKKGKKGKCKKRCDDDDAEADG